MAGSGVVIRRSRLKAATSGIAFGLFVWLGVWLISGDHAPTSRYPNPYAAFLGIMTIGLFGSFLLGTIADVVRPGRLMLDEEGFVFRGVFSEPKTYWRDIKSFELKRRYGSTHVEAIMISASSNDERSLRRILKSIIGGDPFLGLSVRPKRLLAILQDHLDLYGSGSDAGSADAR